MRKCGGPLDVLGTIALSHARTHTHSTPHARPSIAAVDANSTAMPACHCGGRLGGKCHLHNQGH